MPEVSVACKSFDQIDVHSAWRPLTFEKKKKSYDLPRPLGPVFDAHTHLRTFVGEKRDAAEMLSRAYTAGVRGIVSMYDPTADAHDETMDVEAYSAWLNEVMKRVSDQSEDASLPYVRYMVGVHPYDADVYSDVHEKQLAAAVNDPLCVGIGEIGLDYHFDTDDEIEAIPHDVQQETMIRQLNVAINYNVPVQLHLRSNDGDESREAHADALRILKETGIPQAGCVVHCFGENRATLEAFVELGCHITFGGAATFKRNEEVREAFAACPLDRLLLETDCPFMAPEPIRGIPCEPAMVVQNADILIYDRAERTGELPLDIARSIWDTSVALFGYEDAR